MRLLLAQMALVMWLAAPARAAVYTVNSTLDTDDAAADAVCDDGAGHCTLRAAITQANRDVAADIIQFNLAGTGIQSFTPATVYPDITNPLTIDGKTQPGYTSAPLIDIDTGTLFTGLVLSASSTVRGLAIHGAGTALTVNVASTITNNYIGLTASGTKPAQGAGTGVKLVAGTLGGPTPASRNVISANALGVLVSGDGVTIANNYIGPDPTGTLVVYSSQEGISSAGGISSIFNNVVIDSNLISGNSNGVVLYGSGGTVHANLIGTNATGDLALSNVFGVRVRGSGSTISGNTISGHTNSAIELRDKDCGGNVITGNYIGTTSLGTGKIQNFTGIYAYGPIHDNVIGGGPAGRNIISGNKYGFVDALPIGTGNVVTGNWFGLDVTGAADRNEIAVDLQYASSTFVFGGTGGAATRNIVSASGLGVRVVGGAPQIIGNYIGTSADGMSAMPNGNGAVLVTSSDGAVVRDNLIAGNSPSTGIELVDSSNGTYAGNLIGTNATATAALPNQVGILIDGASNNNLIGGPASTDANRILMNTGSGIVCTGGVGNRFRGNVIHGNTPMGIDLAGDGISPNDALDADTGANNLQNFPVVTSAVGDGTQTTIVGTLASTPSLTFTVELFASPVCGEGQTYLGSVDVASDSSGNASFTTAFPGDVGPGKLITATAYQSASGTSEFSACTTVVIGEPADLTSQPVDAGVEDALVPDLGDTTDLGGVDLGGTVGAPAGCGCEVGAAGHTNGAWLGLAMLALVLMRRLRTKLTP